MVMNLPLKQNDMGSIPITCTKYMKESKGTKAVRECRKKMENYTREQRLALYNHALDIIDAAVKEKFKPSCLTCGHNRDMILHDDGKWYCHKTHRI